MGELCKKRVVDKVAYHRHTNEHCEMKRFYVKPETHGSHLGDLLITEIMRCAKLAGYGEMVLDTIKPLKVAIHLYKKHGFEECYYSGRNKSRKKFATIS